MRGSYALKWKNRSGRPLTRQVSPSQEMGRLDRFQYATLHVSSRRTQWSKRAGTKSTHRWSTKEVPRSGARMQSRRKRCAHQLEKRGRPVAHRNEPEVEDPSGEDGVLAGEQIVSRHRLRHVRRQHDAVLAGALGDVVQRRVDGDVRVEVGDISELQAEEVLQERGLNGGRAPGRRRSRPFGGTHRGRRAGRRGSPPRTAHGRRRRLSTLVDDEHEEPTLGVVLEERLAQDAGLCDVVPRDDGAGVH